MTTEHYIKRLEEGILKAEEHLMAGRTTAALIQIRVNTGMFAFRRDDESKPSDPTVEGRPAPHEDWGRRLNNTHAFTEAVLGNSTLGAFK